MIERDQGSACPMNEALAAIPSACPLSANAQAFDMFDGPYQVDPAASLRWSRAEEPVFFSQKLGYWIVTRYDDVKTVFRDNVTFSPAIALEKMTPSSAEAEAVLKKYNYGMNRTLVNEDEPVHMERRRALIHSFTPEELVHHEPMVRKLTRQYVDRFINRGEADLVDEMFWEVPLTVALHFLGVPPEDMDTLREYSIAHTVNTWGRPTPEEQIAVAEAVGKFWQYAGGVLDRMRIEPDGHGWMQYGIRKQGELPDVVTDSYLHSMMMAGIVAAHETTAHASANALRILLEDRDAWDDICADPSLIPNAVEECLRYSGSVVAWRRIAMADTKFGDVAIPAGAKLLIVSASANHDERHFENPDKLDIYRDNTTDHLTFGYGSHQCMGKNLARMEMRIFFEELSKRLPHMELVPGQDFTFVPSTSFRGPDHVRVRWNPALNPERCYPRILDRSSSFPIGAPVSAAVARQVTVKSVQREAEGVASLTLADPHGRNLPHWSPGAHIDMLVGDYVRKYSLCGEPGAANLTVAVLRSADGRGGSNYIHDMLSAGDTVRIRGPKNHFRLDERADRFVLIAGGIGITPIVAIADRLKALGKEYAIHYAVRSKVAAAFTDRLHRDHAEHLNLYNRAMGGRLDLAALIAASPADEQIYACGPERMLTALAGLMESRAERLHVEHFSSTATTRDAADENPFDVYLKDSDLTVHVPTDQTLLHALRSAGLDVPSDCEEGLCGTCEVAVTHGAIDHRDMVLTTGERAANDRMMACCSRAYGRTLTLEL